MDAQQTPSRVARPHRLMVNIDTETRDALRALAYTAHMSQSELAADALRVIVPMMSPFVSAIGKLKDHPHAAMAEMAAHAELVTEQAQNMIEEARRFALDVPPKAPPSSNTGG